MCNTPELQSGFYSLLNSLWLLFNKDLTKLSRIGKKKNLVCTVLGGFFLFSTEKNYYLLTAGSKKGIDTRFLLAARAANVSTSPTTEFLKKLDPLAGVEAGGIWPGRKVLDLFLAWIHCC